MPRKNRQLKPLLLDNAKDLATGFRRMRGELSYVVVTVILFILPLLSLMVVDCGPRLLYN